MGVTLSLLSMLCFGSNILLSRYAMARMPIGLGFFIVLAVNIVFAGAAFGVELLVRKTVFVPRLQEIGLFALGGIVGTYFARRMMFDTVRLLGPARASVVHTSAPAFTLVAAWVFANERLGAYELALMGLALSGLWFTRPSAAGVAPDQRLVGEALSKGLLAGGLTVVGFALGNVCRGIAMKSWNEAIFGTLVASIAALLCQIVATRDWPKVWQGLRDADRVGIGLYALCGVASVCGAIFLVSAMHYMEIALATLVTHTTPLLIFPVSLFLYKNREGLTRRTALGAALVLVAILLLAAR